VFPFEIAAILNKETDKKLKLKNNTLFEKTEVATISTKPVDIHLIQAISR